MSRLHSTPDECVILVKAVPHRSSNYFETVCCAGVGHDYKWRRLYPVPFRILSDSQRFGRWHWLSYDFTPPAADGRAESQKVVPESIHVGKKLAHRERSRMACALTREGLRDATSRNESLTLIKPSSIDLGWKLKSARELDVERAKHAELANQTSLFGEQAKPLEPCPYSFTLNWAELDGTRHNHTCDDWETSTAYFVRRNAYGDQGALASLKETYEEEYVRRGIRLAFSTHSRRQTQWLLVGMLRVDDLEQRELDL